MLKILFVLVGSNIGGIEKSFLSLVNLIKNDYNVSVIFFNSDGELIKQVPDEVKILKVEENLWALGSPQKKVMQKSITLGLKRLIWGGINKYISDGMGYNVAMHNIKKIGNFDIAISYQHSRVHSLYGGTNEYVLSKVQANKKISFIHGDLINAGLNTEYNHSIYRKFDRVVCVSNSCKDVFLKTWPDLEEKVAVVENHTNTADILELAGSGYSINSSILNFIIVTRLDTVKAIKRTFSSFARIKKKFNNFHLYIIGDGNEKIEDVELCKQLNINENVTFLGSQLNPYYYMKNMNALLVLSYQEAAPLVFGEAQILKLPVLTTDTLSAEELVSNRKLGILCKNDEDSIFKMLENVLESPLILKKIKTNIDEYSSNTFEQFRKVVEE